jgi:predicted RNA-binding Zn-ribbon protein involved in translation (DUF1610 family)
LLECPDCGLIEDVDIQGRLFTYHLHGDKSYPDTGLRFEELEKGRFICPLCGNVLVQQDEELEP